MSPLLSIVIVTYNSAALLDECLQSLFDDPAIAECEVILVDNDSIDWCAQSAAARFPGVRLIEMGRNAGFGTANNAGIAHCSSEWVLMANPDTRLAEGGLRSLLDFAHSHPRAGLVGPKLLNSDRSLQESIRNFPTLLRESAETVFLHRAFPRLTTRFANVVHDHSCYASPRTADWVSGAVMLGRVPALKAIGGFDEGFFLYSEEIDLCLRLTRADWEVWYYPEVSFLHIGGEYDTTPFLGLENQRSKLRYYLKHQGRVRMLLVGLVIMTRLAVRSLLWAPAALLRHDGLLRKRLRAALATLVHYPALIARFLVSPVPATVPGLTRESDA